MTEIDKKLMDQAIELAKGCNPIKESIPTVGAIIAIGDRVIGHGQRGTGKEGDDEHAEVVTY
jgi:pyrimidine deaminase RibD-like protein